MASEEDEAPEAIPLLFESLEQTQPDSADRVLQAAGSSLSSKPSSLQQDWKPAHVPNEETSANAGGREIYKSQAIPVTIITGHLGSGKTTVSGGCVMP